MRKYQYYNTGDDNDRDIYGVNHGGQTFTPTIDHLIGSVKLKLFRVGDPKTITVSIKATTASKPVGADLCAGTIEGTEITLDTAGEWYEIPLGNGFSLEKDTQYAIVVKAPDGDASNKVSWRADITSPTYTGGTYCGSTDSGVSWSTYSGVDCMFEEWGVGPPSATAVVWGNLPKSQISNEKIEAAIDRIIQDHEDDPNAHLETGESLESHKASAIIDHIASSIIEDKINNGEISGIKLETSGKVADCIVAASGGDYNNVQAAITAGHKNIFVKRGTYEINTPLVLLSAGITIQGESSENTIIKLANASNCSVIEYGNAATALSGFTIRDIQIDGNKTNQSTGFGAGIHFRGAAGFKIINSTIENCYIHDCWITGIKLDYAEFNTLMINQVNLHGSSGVHLNQSNYNIINGNQVNSNNNYGIRLEHSDHNTITADQTNNNTGVSYGIHLYYSDHNNIVSNQANNNLTNGIYLQYSHNNTIQNNQANNNTNNNGIIINSSDNNIINGNRATGNGLYGIYIVWTDCDKNIVTNNQLIGNSQAGLHDLGTDTEVGHNQE